MFFSLWSYYSTVVTYESLRLLLGNFKLRRHGVDFECLISNFKHISSHGVMRLGTSGSPWLSKSLASPAFIGIVMYLYTGYLVLASAVGIVLCQYVADNLFEWANGGTVFAIQLMPELRIIQETNSVHDHQPFANNYFTVSIGMGITLLLGLFYAGVVGIHSKRGSWSNSLKFKMVVLFVLVTVTSYFKPYIHLSSEGQL